MLDNALPSDAIVSQPAGNVKQVYNVLTLGQESFSGGTGGVGGPGGERAALIPRSLHTEHHCNITHLNHPEKFLGS